MTRFSVRARVRSFRFALRGIATMLRTQHNAWLHLLATIGVLGAGIAWQLGRGDTLWYPRARLFRQPASGDWSGALAEVAGALAARKRL